MDLHASDANKIHLIAPLLVNKSTLSSPKLFKILFNIPVDGDKNENQIPAITTHDKKCGRYDTT